MSAIVNSNNRINSIVNKEPQVRQALGTIVNRQSQIVNPLTHASFENKPIDFNQFEVCSFDCYGTLIDWESGISAALKPLLKRHQKDLSDPQILEFYAEIESEVEADEYVKYRDVLRKVVQQFGKRLGFTPTLSELDCIADSLEHWQPFPDTVDGLQALKKRFKLAIISNVDDDLFALSARHLLVPFDWVITAEQVKAYKPSLQNFKAAIQIIGLPPQKILHIAQSIYHDVVPAKAMKLSTVWVNRRQGKKGFGATPPTSATPNLEVPDLETLVSLMG